MTGETLKNRHRHRQVVQQPLVQKPLRRVLQLDPLWLAHQALSHHEAVHQEATQSTFRP